MNARLIALIIKEFRQLRRDPRMLFITFAAPVIQLFLFGYVATFDIKHIELGVYDQDKSFFSRELIRSFTASGHFDLKYYFFSEKDLKSAIINNKVKIAVNIPPNFSKNLKRKSIPKIQFIVDGSDANSATIGLGYAQTVVRDFFRKIGKGIGRGIAFATQEINVKTRIWYNPDLKSVNFMVPGIIAMILNLEMILLTALAIVKERERGTLEQLIVSPITSAELILGKVLPFIIIAYIDVFTIFLVGRFWFKVPFNGSLPLLLAVCALFLLTSLGQGILISTASRTPRQAMMTVQAIMFPSVLLSGFMFPIANMPVFIQYITYLVPMRYFLEAIRAIFLKGVGINYLWWQIIPLLVFGAIIMVLSIKRFQKKLS
jgi:ABC-2 type transport system permease protein